MRVESLPILVGYHCPTPVQLPFLDSLKVLDVQQLYTLMEDQIIKTKIWHWMGP
jgi:hypothetical protein